LRWKKNNGEKTGGEKYLEEYNIEAYTENAKEGESSKGGPSFGGISSEEGKRKKITTWNVTHGRSVESLLGKILPERKVTRGKKGQSQERKTLTKKNIRPILKKEHRSEKKKRKARERTERGKKGRRGEEREND